MVVVPISFVSEHIETLEEIDMEFKESALEAGITHWERVPAFDCDPKFISALSDIIIEELPNLKWEDINWLLFYDQDNYY